MWACVVGGVVGLLMGGAAGLLGRALDRPAQAVRVCCLARFPSRGDTVRIGRICADVTPADSLSVTRAAAR